MGKNTDADFKPYLFEYRYQGDERVFEVIATSPDDAKERLKAMTFVRLKGERTMIGRIPGGSLIVWLLNAIAG